MIDEKSIFYIFGIISIKYVYNKYGRYPEAAKIEKIMNWPSCINPTELRGFIEIYVYYRIWIKDFAFKVEVFYRLLKKDTKWVWGDEEEHAMAILKEALTTAPALISINYSNSTDLIILIFDASKRE